MTHTVKGVAGNLGAGAVQVAAAELEKAIREGAGPDRIEALRIGLAEVLGPLVQGLNRGTPYVIRAPELTSKDSSTSSNYVRCPPITTVEEMRRYLSDFDAEAGDFLEANRDVLMELFPPGEFAEFEKLVQAFAFEEALERLTRVEGSA